MRGVLLAGVLLLGACLGPQGGTDAGTDGDEDASVDAGCEVGSVACLGPNDYGVCVAQGGVTEYEWRGGCLDDWACTPDTRNAIRCRFTRLALSGPRCDVEGATACEFQGDADGGIANLVVCEEGHWQRQSCECAATRTDGGFDAVCAQ